MNAQNQNPVSSSNPPVYRDWREQRRAERLEARRQRHAWLPYGWLGGTILILLGIAVLSHEMGIPLLTNWWALNILIPACGACVAAWGLYQQNGRLARGLVKQYSSVTAVRGRATN